jgi:hypothetical protein
MEAHQWNVRACSRFQARAQAQFVAAVTPTAPARECIVHAAIR